MTDRTPGWIDRREVVTPDDIRRALQEAIDAGGDPERLNRLFRASVEEAGSLAALARAWTAMNRRERLLAEFREQLDRPKAWRR